MYNAETVRSGEFVQNYVCSVEAKRSFGCCSAGDYRLRRRWRQSEPERRQQFGEVTSSAVTDLEATVFNYCTFTHFFSLFLLFLTDKYRVEPNVTTHQCEC